MLPYTELVKLVINAALLANKKTIQVVEFGYANYTLINKSF